MIKFIYGTVGSGKSLDLLSRYKDLKRRFPNETLLIKPAIDNRTSGVYTRFGNVQVDADLILNFNKLDQLRWYLYLRKYRYFFVDELQFFPVSYIKSMEKHPDKMFYLYGLRTDWKKQSWESTSYAINIADKVVEISSICENCNKNKAIFNKIQNPTEVNSISVGFHFTGVCSSCFNL